VHCGHHLKKGRSQAEGNTLLNGQAGRRIEARRNGVEGIRRRAISGLWVALLLAILDIARPSDRVRFVPIAPERTEPHGSAVSHIGK